MNIQITTGFQESIRILNDRLNVNYVLSAKDLKNYINIFKLLIDL